MATNMVIRIFPKYPATSGKPRTLCEIIYFFLPYAMKKTSLLIIIFFIIVLLTGCAIDNQQTNSSQTASTEKSTSGLWTTINETTWWCDNNWAGETYVFYADNNGLKKCIYQVMGSGVYIVSREFVDFKIINDNEIQIGDIVYKLNKDKLVSKKITLTLHSDKPLIYNRMGQIDIEIAKSDEFVVEDIDKQYEDQKK
ncbi:MAG: hypothetical protein K8S14_07510 [Actinomycetia bacterium]|nr:hypothetical protein [Actinomycetes bacterium]